MGPVDDFQARSRELARRFVRTAVVVDDEAYMTFAGADGPQAEVVAPGRRPQSVGRDGQGPAGGRGSAHALDARSIMDAFSALGVVCGVVGPKDSATEAMRKADIVILDWLLRDGDSRYTLSLLRELLDGERERNSLRLVAIYTGEARLDDVFQAVFDELANNELDPIDNGSRTTIPYRHGQLELYAKTGVNLAEPLKARRIAEGDLPGRLTNDFAIMTDGLLPGIALTSLTAVREGEHKVLDRFRAELDPAFLAHMACLSDPEEAEQQIVAHVAEELRGLVGEAVAAESPAGRQAAESWIRRDGRPGFEFDGRKLDPMQAIQLVTGGLEASNALKSNAFEGLSTGFARPGATDLDERLAWIMSFRTVYNEPPPRLWLGSVITMNEADGGKHLICMRPRCDCVRLKDETTFLFLPLVEPRKRMDQIVVEIDGAFIRLGVGPDPSGWVLRQFQPTGGSRAVTATRSESEGNFEFTDTRGVRYAWRGELKAEFAQRIAQTFTANLSRVAVDESEWLRRMAGTG